MMKVGTSLWFTGDVEHVAVSGGYTATNSDMAEHGWLKVKDVEIDFEPLTREEAISGVVPLLRAKKAAIYAAAEKRAREVEEEIQNLLSLTYEEAK